MNVVRTNRGFTLVEVLVATVLIAVAVTGVFGAMRSVAATDAKARDLDFLQRLAEEKINDVRVLDDPAEAPASGDFADRGHSDVAWTVSVQQSGAPEVDQVVVTATRGSESETLTTLMFAPPEAESGTGSPSS